MIPEEQHRATAKEEGEASHVERWINTLRQRLSLASCVRRSPFPSRPRYTICSLKVFICRSNLERQSIIPQSNTTEPGTPASLTPAGAAAPGHGSHEMGGRERCQKSIEKSTLTWHTWTP